MSEPTFPPRLRASSDAATRSVLDALAKDPVDASRAAQALARFEAVAPLAATPRSKWRPMAKVFLASLVAIGAFKTITYAQHTPEAAPAITVTPSPIAPAPSAPEFEPESSQNKAVRVEDLPTAAPEAAVPLPPRPAAIASAGSTFRDELALVQAARASLKAGDSDACLGSLDRYDRLYHGSFVDEVVTIRVEALIAKGDGARARTIGEDFLAKHPESPYESRIRSLLAKAP